MATKAIFDKVDATKAGYVDLPDWTDAFNVMDSDASEDIDVNDFVTYFGEPARPAFVPIGGSDGKITREEWLAFFKKASGSDSQNELEESELQTALGAIAGGKRRRGKKSLKKTRGGRKSRKNRRKSRKH
jgi:hypothetical protein